ncbi:MAG: family 16 glycosylhydrolase [Sphingobium sp.]
MPAPSTSWINKNYGASLDLSGYEVTFNDDFNSLDLGTSSSPGKWYSGVHTDFGETVFGRGETAAVPFSVSDGILNIQMKQVNGQWQSGLLQTTDANNVGFSQAFGYFEMRAAFPAGAGSWPAFWLISENLRSTPGQPRVEVDVIEAYGLDPKGLHTAVHYRPNLDTPEVTTHDWGSDYTGLKTSLFDGAYHTFGTMITDQWIVTYYDGKEMARVAANEYTRAPFHMIVDLAMSDDSRADPNAVYDMKVDYIRAYANPTLSGQWASLPLPTGSTKGNDNNNSLTGTAGADVLAGGKGDDTYYLNHAGDKVVEKNGEGVDKVITPFSFSMVGQYIENLVLTGTAHIDGTGNSLANQITGNSGNNVIDGGGGADIMIGGAGNDVYHVDNIGDKVVELANEGNDTVYSSVNFSLAGQFIETLVLTGGGNLNGTGNGYANAIVGNGGNNILDGGAGADIMTGGKGNDSYYVDNAGDRVVEIAGEGSDTVISSITFSLDGLNVETLRLTGSAALGAFGSAGNDSLYGNDGNNVLDGRAGADIMAGGKGDDVYYVDNIGDMVIEKTGEGMDTVYSSVSFSLAGQAIEKLALTGTANIDAIGGGLDNILVGNSSNNLLSGGNGSDTLRGGFGKDILIGDTGTGRWQDFFVFDQTPGGQNVDTVMDFQRGLDKVQLSAGVFKGVGASGLLNDGALQFGTQSTSAGAHMVYDQTTGALYYDSDGTGASPQSLVAYFANLTSLTAGDFMII